MHRLFFYEESIHEVSRRYLEPPYTHKDKPKPICPPLFHVFGVGVSCRTLYSFVVYLYVNGSGSITSVGEERANLSDVVYL